MPIFTTHLNNGAGATLEGDDVTLFFRTGGGKVQVHSNSKMHVKAPDSGLYKGVLFFQGRGNSEQFIINTTADLDLDGLIYVPDGEFLINSNATISPVTGDVAAIVNRILINSGSTLHIDRDIGACGASTRLPDLVTAMCLTAVPGSG
jgi:hypothetical protein